ncbi:Uncharacterized protein PCOAH_00028040 [Plasmodium coatneyi]|uniref:Sporozoite asparagine-rich protein n=1 Tax=Plasmodium coatneyi TaxID=208452 RepID=A0A1B1E0E3_9APIC|nr:Uncharacterized protein PCOAH_00028040 [Plasmodium coatneyi]ANQ08365.1 Uncharacterized protein PCOAH_00028040 [Plasmodium coatneyi]
MFLRGENKNIFFAFFSYFMSKNELDIIFEHYDIGLIVLTKIHNIRKKYEDEKNSVQEDDNNLDKEDEESFEKKVRAFFLNYNMDPPHGQNENTENGNNNCHKKGGMDVINDQTDGENYNKSDVRESNSFPSIGKTEGTKREGDNNQFHNKLHTVEEGAPQKVDHRDNHSVVQDDPQNADTNRTAQTNPHEITCNQVTNKSTLKSEGTTDHDEMCRKKLKLKVEECHGENEERVTEHPEQGDNSSTSGHNTLSSNENPSLKLKNLNGQIHNLRETKKRNAQEIGKLIKIEAIGEENGKGQMRTGYMCQNIHVQKRLQKEKQTQGSKNGEKRKENKGGKQHMSVEVKREIVRNEAIVGGRSKYGEIPNGEKPNDASKHHTNETIKPNRETNDTIFPERKKNETYKKFSKRINRKKINDFVDYSDEHCFYITDLCKKGTMLTLKMNQLTNQHRYKYKFPFYPKFTNQLITNQYVPFSREVQPLNKMRMNLKLFKHLNGNPLTTDTLNQLGHPQNSAEKRSSNLCDPFNEYDILQSFYKVDENHISNHTYTLDNVESVVHNTCNCCSFKNLQNAICDLNEVDIPTSGRNAGNQGGTRVLSFNIMKRDNEKGVVEKDEGCRGDAPAKGSHDQRAATNGRSDSCKKLRNDQHDFQNKIQQQVGGNNAKATEQFSPMNHLTDLLKREPTLSTTDGHHKMYNEGDCISCSINPNDVATPNHRNEHFFNVNTHLEDNNPSSNSYPNGTYSAYPQYPAYPQYSPFPYNSNFQGNPMISSHLSNNHVENYFTNTDGTNCRIINMSFNPNGSIPTNVQNNPVMKTPHNSMYPMSSNSYILNRSSISLFSDGNILTDNPLPNCNVNLNCFKNDLFNARKSFSHNNYYHHLNPYYIFKYNNHPGMTMHNYYNNDYARMNNRSSSYTNGRIANRALPFADREYINMLSKNYTKRSFHYRNNSNQDRSSRICNHNFAPSMCNQNDHLNHQTNSRNGLFHMNQYNSSHIGSTPHGDKKEGNAHNPSGTNRNQLLSASYNDNVNPFGASIPGECFHNTSPINLQNQSTLPANILMNVQSAHGEQVKKMQSLITDTSISQICSFKDGIPTLDGEASLQNVALHHLSDELPVGNENGDATGDSPKTVKHEIEDTHEDAEISNPDHHVEGKHMITQGESPNNNEEAHQQEGPNYALTNTSHRVENKESGIAGDIISIGEVRADSPQDNKTMRTYSNTTNMAKQEKVDLHWMALSEVSTQGAELEGTPNQIYHLDSEQQQKQQSEQGNLPHVEDPHFSANAQHEHLNGKDNILPSTLNQGDSPQSEGPIIQLNTHEQNDAGNEKKAHRRNSEIIMCPPPCHVNYLPHPIKSEPIFHVQNVYNQVREENKDALNYHVRRNNYTDHLNRMDEVLLESNAESIIAHTNEQRSDTNYALNQVNYFPLQNGYNNKEDKYRTVKEINKVLVQNSENYVLTKQEIYRNATHNTAHLQPHGMNDFTPSMENGELVQCMMERNVNMDIIRDELNNSAGSTFNGSLGKGIPVNTVNNMNVYTNSTVDKGISRSEFPAENLNYQQSNNVFANNYLGDSHFNTPQQLQYYTQNHMMPTNFPHLNAYYVQNKIPPLENKDHFEPSNVGPVQHTQQNNYDSRINTNVEDLSTVDPCHMVETQNYLHHTYMPYDSTYYNGEINQNSSFYGGNVENMNPFNDDHLNVSYNNCYLTRYNTNNHYDNTNERNMYEQGLLNQFKSIHGENHFPFYNPLSAYAEGTVTKQRNDFNQNDEAKIDEANNNASAASSIRNGNNITNSSNNSNNNEGGTIIQTHSFFNRETNNLYSQANMETTQNLNENNPAYSHPPGSGTLNKINEKYQPSEIDTSNNLHGNIQSDITKNSSLCDFLQSENNNQYEMIARLAPRQSPNCYVNATNATANVFNVQTTDHITNVLSNNVEQVKWDHFLDHTNPTYHDPTGYNFHQTCSGQNGVQSRIHMQNIPPYNNLASLNDTLQSSLTNGMTNQNNNNSCYRNDVTNYNQCSTFKRIPVTNLSLAKMQNGNIEKESFPRDALPFSNATNGYRSDDNRTDKRLNQLFGDQTSEDTLAIVKQENEFSTDRGRNGDELNDAHLCGPPNSAGTYVPQNNHLQQIISHFNPYNNSYNVMHPVNYHPNFINGKNYHPYFAPHNFNLINGHEENNAAHSKNTFLCINEGPTSEQANSTITYDVTNDMNPPVNTAQKSNYNTNCYNLHNGVEVKKEVFSHDLEHTKHLDSFQNGYHLTFDPNGDKRNIPLNNNQDVNSLNLRMLNSCHNICSATTNDLPNYKHQPCNNINNVNAFGNNFMNAFRLDKTCKLRDNQHGMPNLTKQKGKTGTLSNYPLNGGNNDIEGNNPTDATCMNDVNKFITPNEERTEYVNSLLPFTNRSNNPNGIDKLSSFFGNTIASGNCLNNQNRFLQQQSTLCNILGNGGSQQMLCGEFVNHHPMSLNCLSSNNYNTYMYLFYLYKQMENRNYSNSISVAGGTNGGCEKHANEGPRNSQKIHTQQNTNQDSINHYRETENSVNNNPLYVGSDRNVSNEINRYIENYQNQLNCINSTKDNLLNCNVYNVGVLYKNDPQIYSPNYPLHFSNSNTLSSTPQSSNPLGSNPLCLNVLNSAHPSQHSNYSTHHLTEQNKLLLNDNSKNHVGSNINYPSNQWNNILHRDGRTQNGDIPLHIPLINYYNLQLLLSYLRERQIYNSMNQDATQATFHMSGKKDHGDNVTARMNSIANNNWNDYNSKNRGYGKSTLKDDFMDAEKDCGKTNAKGGIVKKMRKHGYSISSVGFSNRSKRWTICPSYICCNSALCRFKLTCNFKFLQFNQNYNTFNTPCAVFNCYKNIMNKHNYFTSTLCPQQTYLSKHSAQEHETIFNVYWHLLNKEKYQYIQNIILFLDSNLYTRAVWLLKKGYSMDDFQVQKAERKLIKLMLLVFKFTHDYKNDTDKYEHIKSFLYSLKSSHINFELMNRFLFY